MWLKPEKHYGRVYTLVQINYHNGLVRQFGFGPGWVPSGSGSAPCPDYSGLDLRDMKACKKPKLKGIATLLAQPAVRPVVKAIPDKLEEAAKLFLSVRKSELTGESYKTIPAAVRRFVTFVGSNTITSDITAKDWRLFKRTLKAEVTEKKLQITTARVTHNRVRELFRWLMEHKAIENFEMGSSARKELQ